jgi:SAM-dependent methyltransferase
MLISEAEWIGDALSALPVNTISPCLNLGSSTAHFREVSQPYIEDHIIAPNKARGVRFIHADMKEAPGVDVTGDISDPGFQAQLGAIAPGSILCCNMFEHVLDRQELANVCSRIVRPGGYIIVSVPNSFPYHLDPIDTYYRPTPAKVAALFPDCRMVMSDIVLDTTYWRQLSELRLSELIPTLCKTLVHLPVPFYKWERWKSRVHPLFWLFCRYRISISILQRNGVEGSLREKHG